MTRLRTGTSGRSSPGGGACLEVGCGTWVHAGTVRELGWTPVGVDLSAGMLRHARGRLAVARADAERLPIRADMPAYPAVLAEAAPVLRPGGVLVHVGVHPCFWGGFADCHDPDAVVIAPGYLDGTGPGPPGPTRGCGLRSGPPPPPARGAACVPRRRATLERFTEEGAPTPAVLAVRARKPRR